MRVLGETKALYKLEWPDTADVGERNGARAVPYGIAEETSKTRNLDELLRRADGKA